MPDFAVVLSDEQIAALHSAAHAAKLSTSDFVRRALAVLSATYGIEFPDTRSTRIQMPQLRAVRSKTGRPRRQPGPMTRHVPAGNWERVCPWCGRTFRTDTMSVKFCADECEIAAQNQRSYQRRKRRE